MNTFVLLLATLAAGQNTTTAIDPSSPTQTFMLENGLRVVLETDVRGPLVTILLHSEHGAQYEAPEHAGLAHLALSSLLHNRAPATDRTYAQIFTDLDAAVATQVHLEGLEIILQVHSDALERTLSVLGAMLESPSVDAKIIAQQRVLLATPQKHKQNATEQAKAELRKLLYADQRIAIATHGSAESLERIRAAQVNSFLKQVVSSSSLILSVLGDADGTSLAPLLKKSFAKLKKTTADAVLAPIWPAGQNTRLILIDQPHASRATAVCGHASIRCSDETGLATEVAVQLLADDVQSQSKTAAQVTGLLETNAMSGTVFFVISAPPQDLPQALLSLQRRMTVLGRTGPSSQALQQAKARSAHLFMRAAQQVEIRAHMNAQAQRWPQAAPLLRLQQINALSKRDVSNATKLQLLAANVRCVVIASQTDLLESLQSFAPLQVRPAQAAE